MFSTGPSVRPCVHYIPACPGRSIRRPACCRLLVLFCSIVDNGFSVRYQNISRENRAVVRSETTLVNSWLGCDRHSRSFTIPECYLHISCTSQVFIRTALDYHCIHVCLVHISCFSFVWIVMSRVTRRELAESELENGFCPFPATLLSVLPTGVANAIKGVRWTNPESSFL